MKRTVITNYNLCFLLSTYQVTAHGRESIRRLMEQTTRTHPHFASSPSGCSTGSQVGASMPFPCFLCHSAANMETRMLEQWCYKMEAACSLESPESRINQGQGARSVNFLFLRGYFSSMHWFYALIICLHFFIRME